MEVKSLVLDGKVEKYNRRNIYINGKILWLKSRQFTFLVKLAVARTNQTLLTVDDGWISTYELDKSSYIVRQNIYLLRKDSGLNIVSSGNNLYKLNIDLKAISFNHKILSEDQDYTISSLFKDGFILDWEKRRMA